MAIIYCHLQYVLLLPLVRKKQNMRLITRRNQQESINEKNLFHGTTPDSVEAICKQNFDWRLHGRNASKYGEGSYFAVNASYSHSYAKRDGNMSQFIFLTKVLVGSYTQGHSSYRRPPPKQQSDPASDLYDSCVDNKSNPTIFVVFDTDQFYPEYIIQYSSAQPEAPTKNTTVRSMPKPVSAHTSLNSLNTVPKPSLPIINSNTAARPQPKPERAQTSLNSFIAAFRPRLPAGNISSYSAAAVSSSSIASTNATTFSNKVGAALNAYRSAVRGGHSQASQASALQPPTTTMSASPTFQTYPRGILKKKPTSYSRLGSSS